MLFDLIFSFARLANSLPSMHDVKQHEYKVKCVCVTILSRFLHLSALFFSLPIKTQYSSSKEGRLNACASTEHMNADKVGQESTTGIFLQFGFRQVVCMCDRKNGCRWLDLLQQQQLKSVGLEFGCQDR